MTIKELKDRLNQLMREFHTDDSTRIVLSEGDDMYDISKVYLRLLKGGRVTVNIDLTNTTK